MEPSDFNLLQNLDSKLKQYEAEKSLLEKLIAARRLELVQLDNLLTTVSKSIETQKEIQDAVENKKSASVEPKTPGIDIQSLLNKVKEKFEPKKDQISTEKLKADDSQHKDLVCGGGWKSPKKVAEYKFRPSAAPTSTISRINQVLKECTKRAEPKKVIQHFPNRLGPAPGLNSKLAELHRNEPDENNDYTAVTEWVTIKFTKRNKRLETVIEKRNREKLERLKREPNLAGFVQRRDLVGDLKLLMGYDMCRPKPGNPKPKKQRTTKEKKQNDVLFELCDFEMDARGGNPDEAKLDDDADLYGDLNQPIANLDHLNSPEEGEVADEETIKNTPIDVHTIKIKDNNLVVQNTAPRKLTNESIRRPESRNSTAKENVNNDRRGHEYNRYKKKRSRSRSRSRSRGRNRNRSRSRSKSKKYSKSNYSKDYRDRSDRHTPKRKRSN